MMKPSGKKLPFSSKTFKLSPSESNEQKFLLLDKTRSEEIFSNAFQIQIHPSKSQQIRKPQRNENCKNTFYFYDQMTNTIIITFIQTIFYQI